MRHKAALKALLANLHLFLTVATTESAWPTFRRGDNQNQQAMVKVASSTPTTKDGQNDKPVRSATANGTKNGKPSGTSINVSLASKVIVAIS